MNNLVYLSELLAHAIEGIDHEIEVQYKVLYGPQPKEYPATKDEAKRLANYIEGLKLRKRSIKAMMDAENGKDILLATVENDYWGRELIVVPRKIMEQAE